MVRIPVGETIANGYGFAARKALANVGLTWLTATFYAFAVYYWLEQFSTTMLVSPHPGGTLNDFALFDLVCLVAVTALASAALAVALTRAAMEPGDEFVAAYFLFTRREWSLFIGLLLFYALGLAALAAIIFGGDIAIAVSLPLVSADTQWQGISALTAMNAAVAFISVAICIFLTIRLGFFLAPIAAAERSLRMTHAWALSHGNFWRLLVVVGAISLPIVLLWAAVDWALVGQQFSGALTDALSPRHDSTALYQLISDNGGVFAMMCAVMLVLFNILFAGASAFAYPLLRDSAYEEDRRVTPAFIEPSFAGSFAAPAAVLANDVSTFQGQLDERQDFVAQTAEPPQTTEIVAPEYAPAADMPALASTEEAPEAIKTASKEIPIEPIASDDTSQADMPAFVEDAVVAKEAEAEDHPIDSISELPMPAPKPKAPELVTPPPSPADATEFSPPSVPSEAA